MRAKAFLMYEPVGPEDHAIGPEDASITVVEYGDFECPHCKQATGAVKLLLARFEHRIRFVYRHFPLDAIHPHATDAAEVAECAAAQGMFWQMHDLLFENQRRLMLTDLYDYARLLGLDMVRFTEDMNDQVYLPRVQEQQRSGQLSGVRSTPAFFVNGRVQDVSFGMRALFEAVKVELSGPSMDSHVF